MVSILMNTPRVDERWCRKHITKYIKPWHKVLVIPFSYHEDFIPDEDAWHAFYDPGQQGYEEIVIPLTRIGIQRENIAFVNYFTDTPKTMGQLIYEADVVDLPGGYPDRIMQRLWEFGAISQLSAYPGVMLGFSAGAMVQLDTFHATPEEEGQEFYWQEGLDRIERFDLEVHWCDDPVQRAGIRRALEEGGRTVIAMEDRGGLILDNGRLTRMGRVHFFKPGRPNGY